MRIAIIGATGVVGREMVKELEHYQFSCDLDLYASSRSQGQEVLFNGKTHIVKAFELDLLKGVDFILMSAGSDFSRQWAAKLAESGSVVIDNSSAWRMDPDVPLIVPEVNASSLKTKVHGGAIVANPNCSTIQMVVTLKPLLDAFGLRSVSVATYQSVSGTGKQAIEELSAQREQYVRKDPLTSSIYDRTIVNNLIPAIDRLDDQGHCFEEQKMVEETRKILEKADLPVFANTVRVPISICHSESMLVGLSQEVGREDLMRVFGRGKGVVLSDGLCYQDLPDPQVVAGNREVWVSRVRLPFGKLRSEVVQYWNVADNLKKGAATNAVQILKCLL